MLVGRAFQCTTVLEKKLNFKLLAEVGFCLHAKGWMNLDSLRLGIKYSVTKMVTRSYVTLYSIT